VVGEAFDSQRRGSVVMGKHHDKIAAALEVRKANHKSGQGGKVPGSMNKKKTGYRSIKSNEAKRLLSK
jgi:hypothetical protein